jgi:hypothetical protein
MADEERFLTFKAVGIMLGGREQPLGRPMLNRLLARGDLIDNGLPHKARRISRKSVNALLTRMEEGGNTESPTYMTSPKAKSKGARKPRSTKTESQKRLADEWKKIMEITLSAGKQKEE